MEKYYEILDMIKAERLDITKLYLLSCLAGSHLGTETEIKQMNYCYDVWLKADTDIELSKLADIVETEWENIQNKTYKKSDIIEMCLYN